MKILQINDKDGDRAIEVADDDPRLPPLPTLADVQAAKTAELTAACAAEITGGYQSVALGAPHTYPSKITDQINMMGSVTDSLIPDLPDGWTTPFWCADDKGVWSYQSHTAAQIQAAGRDGKTAIATAQTKLAGLNVQVASAKTPDDVAAITWLSATP